VLPLSDTDQRGQQLNFLHISLDRFKMTGHIASGSWNLLNARFRRKWCVVGRLKHFGTTPSTNTLRQETDMTSWRKVTAGISAVTAAALISTFVAAQTTQPAQQTDCISGKNAAASREENNKRIVIEFYNKALNDKDPDQALKYVGDYYKQHNPLAEDGREGLRKFIEWIRSDHPDSHSDIKHVFADGDYVLLNVHMVRFPGERGLAIGEIFRLQDRKIVEHWDRIQAIPETAKNNNGMF
jgi:predicted SnoaL-like aldol condensation-catalyzing enzyme